MRDEIDLGTFWIPKPVRDPHDDDDLVVEGTHTWVKAQSWVPWA